MGENQACGGEEEEERCSPCRAVCAPPPPSFSSHVPRVMGESCAALIAASVLGAAAAREEAELSAFALRPCREPLRGG